MQERQSERGLSAEPDNYLVSLSTSGDTEATAILIVRYLGIIHKIAAHFSAHGIEHDDFVQEGLIGFLSAVKTYNGEHRCSFNTYARICVLNRLKKTASFAATNKYSMLTNASDIDEPGGDPEDRGANPEDLIVEQETLGWFSKEIGEQLSERERKVFLWYLEGYEPSQIAGALKVSPKSVYNALGRVRKKLGRAYDQNQNS